MASWLLSKFPPYFQHLWAFPIPKATLLSTQLLETYSATFDTAFFERHPISWNVSQERFTIRGVWSCKLYWYNIFIVLILMNGSFTMVIVTRFLNGNSPTWVGIFFPLIGTLIGSMFEFLLLAAHYAFDVVELIENLVKLERAW
ncbi:hypothetical protein Fcan01_23826 [Folsomia candida]|uniref:Uncharacterized protein n=1 Tax=Folsomia candida TaxID=158441 RepID=A0A226D7A3_FOLCA|nr:hypothetical protein Fcan01_23826 [Folsomia candida]